MLDWWTHQPGRSCSLWLYAFLPCTAAAGGLIFDVCMVLSLMSVNLTVKLPDTLNAGQGPTRPTDLPCHLLPLCGASRLLHGVCPLPLELLDNEPDSGGRLVTQGGDHNRSWKVVGKTSGLVRRGALSIRPSTPWKGRLCPGAQNGGLTVTRIWSWATIQQAKHQPNVTLVTILPNPSENLN